MIIFGGARARHRLAPCSLLLCIAVLGTTSLPACLPGYHFHYHSGQHCGKIEILLLRQTCSIRLKSFSIALTT